MLQDRSEPSRVRRWGECGLVFVVSCFALAGCHGPEPSSEDGRLTVDSVAACRPEDCTDLNGDCQTCICPASPPEDKVKVYSGTTPKLDELDRTPIAEAGAGSCMGDPCNDNYQTQTQCSDLNRDYPTAGCTNQSLPGAGGYTWLPAWLSCQKKRGTIKSGSNCGGQCPSNMGPLIDMVKKNCAGDTCGGTGPADCIRCLQNQTRIWLGTGQVCGSAATCMMEFLKDWYPDKCTKKCNSAAAGTNQCTHAWVECTIGNNNYYFDGNNGAGYSCPK